MRLIMLLGFCSLLILSACKQDSKGNDSASSGASNLPMQNENSMSASPGNKTAFAPGEFDPRLTQDDLSKMMKYFDDRTLGSFQFDSRGFLYQMKSEGNGKSPQLGDQVVVNYEGRLTDDKEFDSTFKTGKPLTYQVGKMIPGFDAAVMSLKPGGKGLFVFPAFLGYENKSVKDHTGKELIPPKSILVFTIELVSVK